MAEAKKFVITVMGLHDERDRRKVLQAVTCLEGVDVLSVDMKAQNVTVVGSVDSVKVVERLRRKGWNAALASLGPAKEPEKKEAPKETDKGKEASQQTAYEIMCSHGPPRTYHLYHAQPICDESPNSCGIM